MMLFICMGYKMSTGGFERCGRKWSWL